MSFGQRLRERRKELGLSQGELAKALGVSLSAVSNYENGLNAMREDVLLRLFSVLDVDPNYLYQDDFENKGPACGPDELSLLQKYRETTFRDYLLDIRMRHAAELLKNTRLPVREVALAAGYHNSSHFYRLFERHFGVSPAIYRTDF